MNPFDDSKGALVLAGLVATAFALGATGVNVESSKRIFGATGSPNTGLAITSDRCVGSLTSAGCDHNNGRTSAKFLSVTGVTITSSD